MGLYHHSRSSCSERATNLQGWSSDKQFYWHNCCFSHQVQIVYHEQHSMQIVILMALATKPAVKVSAHRQSVLLNEAPPHHTLVKGLSQLLYTKVVGEALDKADARPRRSRSRTLGYWSSTVRTQPSLHFVNGWSGSGLCYVKLSDTTDVILGS